MIDVYISSLILSITWLSSYHFIGTDDYTQKYYLNIFKELVSNYIIYIVSICATCVTIFMNYKVTTESFIFSYELINSIQNSINIVFNKSLTYIFIIEVMNLLSTGY